MANTLRQESNWHQQAAAQPGSVLLRTARPDAENPHSYLFTNPLQILAANSLDEIPALFHSIEQALQNGHHVAGFLSYEAGYHFEPSAMGTTNPALSNLPLAWFGVYLAPLIQQEPVNITARHDEPAEPLPTPTIGLSQAEYCNRIQQIRQHIEAGDFYQANFTVKLLLPCEQDAAHLFASLMQNQPVAYGALIHAINATGSAHILSASPELFFRKRGNQITVRPMKGTAPRGRDLEEDARIAAWLAADEKNRAENVMIVDLMRNDLGRICQTGSVNVTGLFTIERYPQLLQMTSTVQGELKPAISYYEIFRALFPCGSITGAPKVQTMRTIRELEGEPRGIACGAIGFFSPAGDAVFSVAIRTVMLQNGEAQLRVGSGITHDSDPRAEYEECLLKSRFLTHPAPRFELIETLAWTKDLSGKRSDDFFLLDLHLQRLQNSAAYFDFRFDKQSIREQLHQFAQTLAPETSHRVRLLLSRSGTVTLASTPLVPARNPALLYLSPTPVDSTSIFLRHKTTHRTLQNNAFVQAQTAGCDDAIFLNEHGQVTECAIHNLMIAKNGKLITPPVECGLLPGVYRQHLLATHPEIEVAPISLRDLLSASRIFLFNSVRGLRYARIQNRPVA